MFANLVRSSACQISAVSQTPAQAITANAHTALKASSGTLADQAAAKYARSPAPHNAATHAGSTIITAMARRARTFQESMRSSFTGLYHRRQIIRCLGEQFAPRYASASSGVRLIPLCTEMQLDSVTECRHSERVAPGKLSVNDASRDLARQSTPPRMDRPGRAQGNCWCGQRFRRGRVHRRCRRWRLRQPEKRVVASADNTLDAEIMAVLRWSAGTP